MPDVVGVVFHNGGRIYSYDPGPLVLAPGDQIVVPTQRGQEVGRVVHVAADVPPEELTGPLKTVVRAVTDEDRATLAANEDLRREALRTCRELIAQHGLDMKLVDAEVVFGGGKILFSFFAEERVDFRALVSDLARALNSRIELRQIGAREEARMVGGLGLCGRALCCTRFQGDQEPVSIRMAKEQSLPLNPMKISGLCGRLMCCLKYEQDQYVAFRKEAPRCGTPVECGHGEGVVIGYQVPKDALAIRLADGTIVEEPIARCSCGGAPCRVVAEDDPAAGSMEPAELGEGACSEDDETIPAAVGPDTDLPDLAGFSVPCTEPEAVVANDAPEEGTVPSAEPSEADGGDADTSAGSRGRRRSRPRRRRRRPSGDQPGDSGPAA